MAKTRKGPGTGSEGVSLIEVLVALTIFALLLGLAGPSYARWMAEQRLMGEARRLAESLALARSEALKRNARVQLCPGTSTTGCADNGGWHQGWTLFVDRDSNADIDAGEAIVAVELPSEQPITITGNRPVAHYVSFTAIGRARLINGALQMGTFTICLPGLKEVQVVLANTGRTRIERTQETCA